MLIESNAIRNTILATRAIYTFTHLVDSKFADLINEKKLGGKENVINTMKM